MGLFKWTLSNSSINVKCGAAKIYGLRLGFSNSNLSSHATKFYLIWFVFAAVVEFLATKTNERIKIILK